MPFVFEDQPIETPAAPRFVLEPEEKPRSLLSRAGTAIRNFAGTFSMPSAEEAGSAEEARQNIATAQSAPYAAPRERAATPMLTRLSDEAQKIAAGPVGGAVESALKGISRAAPFPAVVESVADYLAGQPQKTREMGEVLNPLPEIVTDPFQRGIEAVRKHISPDAAKLIEDTMAAAPAFMAEPRVPLRTAASYGVTRLRERMATPSTEPLKAEPAFVRAPKEDIARAKIPEEGRFVLEEQKPAALEAPGTTIAETARVGERPPSEVRPAPTIDAAAEVKSEVQRVATAASPAEAKAVKTTLVARLEEALKTARPESEYGTEPGKLGAPKKVTISIPGDGDFTISATQEALSEVLARAKRIQTTTEPSQFKMPSFKRTGKVTPEEIAAKYNAEELTRRASQEETGQVAATVGFPAEKEFAKESPASVGGQVPPSSEPGSYGFPEIRKTPKDVPQSITPLERKFQPPPPSPIGAQPVVRRGDIIRDMQDAFQVPIRTGHGNFAQMKAAGFFKVKEEVIRLKKANDMEVTAHEVGHFISKKFLGRKAARLPGSDELLSLGHELYGSRKPHGGYAEEGLAEFIRFYVVDPAKAEARAPKFFKYFEDATARDFPDVRDTLQHAREGWKRYQEQPAVARVLSQISVGESKPRAITLDGLYKNALDDLQPIKVFTDRMNAGKPPLRTSDNPYTLARLFRGWVGKADLFLKDKPIDFDTLRPIEEAKPLGKILAPFEKAGQLDDLRAYLTARRSAELMKRGKETGFEPGDIKATLDTYNGRREFVQAAEDLGKYNDSLLLYLAKSGVLGKESLAKIIELNKEYVPFYRLIEGEQGPSAMGAGRKFANLGSPIKRIKGSAREIIDPLESTVKNTYAILSVADRNAVGQALVKLANEGEGMGKYIEKVPRDKIPVTLKDEELHRVLARYGRIKQTEKFQTSKKEFSREIGAGGEAGEPGTKGQQLIENRVKEALTARGFSEGEAGLYIQRLKGAKTDVQINSVIEKIISEQTIRTVTKALELDLPPQVVAAFRPNPKVPGMDNILSVRFDGKPILYQVHPELYEAMAGLDRNSTNMLVKILSLPARALRLGATTLSPEFAVRNPVRDQWTAAIFSQYGYKPGIDLIRGLAHVIKNDELYQAWKAGGGEHSMLVSLDRTRLQKTLSEVIRSGEARGIARTIVTHPIDSLRMLSELGEAGTRVGEFARGIEKEGGLTKENILKSAMASREVTLDFARQGAAMKASAANQVIAFLNANVQGIDKMARFAKENPGLFTARGVATITIPSLLLYAANHDDPRYTELPRWQRDLFWIVPTGQMDSATWAKMSAREKQEFNDQHTVWRIPKPFELGILFGTLPERTLDWIAKNDPEAMREFRLSFFNSLPNPIPTGALPLIENMANWSMFRERRIVPQGKEDVAPAMQYTPFTSEVSRRVGAIVNYSPAKIDNLIRGYFGGLGQMGLDIAGAPLKRTDIPEPGKTLADVPMVRGFVTRFPGQPESIERFYQKYGDAMEVKNSLDLLKRERKIEQARAYAKEHHEDLVNAARYSKTAEALSALRKQSDRIREDTNLAPEIKRQRLDALTFRMADVATRVLGKQEDRDDAVNE